MLDNLMSVIYHFQNKEWSIYLRLFGVFIGLTLNLETQHFMIFFLV